MRARAERGTPDVVRLLPERPLTRLADYLDAGGGRGLDRAQQLGPAQILDEVDRAGLRGRGGAGFPTATKWRSCLDLAAEYDCPLYLVANGAEGEPGTYKDRPLLQRNPFLFLEGLLIARLAVRPAGVFVGLKASFEREVAALQAAQVEAAEAGWPGADEVVIALGPKDYLFGEETGLLEVIQGNPALPRILGPYQEGLYATDASPNPTVVNNVETIANLPRIIGDGVEAYRAEGTETSPGTMLFTVVGDVDAPGVYELAFGETLRTLIVDIAGAHDVKAVYSGTSNAVITPDMLDDPLDFEVLRSDGAGIGSGGFVVYDSSRPILRVLHTLSGFLARESCGQCNPCKLGTGAITDLLGQLCRGEGDEETVRELWSRVRTVTDSNRCFLPVGEQLMVGSTLQHYAAEIAAGLGRPVPDADVPVPLIADLDLVTGEVVYAG